MQMRDSKRLKRWMEHQDLMRESTFFGKRLSWLLKRGRMCLGILGGRICAHGLLNMHGRRKIGEVTSKPHESAKFEG